MPAVAEYAKPKRHRQCNSLSEVAVLLKCNRRTLEGWSRDGLIRPSDKGKWSTKDIYSVFVEKEKEKTEPKEPKGTEYWKEKILMVQYEEKQLGLRKRKGELLEKSDVDRLNCEKIVVLKTALLSLGDQLEPDLMQCKRKGEMSRLIRKKVESLIQQFADQTEVSDSED